MTADRACAIVRIDSRDNTMCRSLDNKTLKYYAIGGTSVVVTGRRPR